MAARLPRFAAALAAVAVLAAAAGRAAAGDPPLSPKGLNYEGWGSKGLGFGRLLRPSRARDGVADAEPFRFVGAVAALMAVKSRLRDEKGVMALWDINSVDPCTWSMVACSPDKFVVSL
jgi:hypothetical protein